MTPTIPQPPERPASPAELADEAARVQRALAGSPLPRTLHALIEQGARLVPCGQCWAHPAAPCHGQDGYHLARFCRAHRRGLITDAELRLVVLPAAGDVFTAATILRPGAR